MKYKYFLFDWDGTLADSLPIWVPALRDTFADFGIEVSEKTVGERVIANWNGPEELGIRDREAFFKNAQDRLSIKLSQVELVAGVRELITEIKASGGSVGILTSSMREWVLPAVKNLKIADMIDFFVAKEDVVNNKPNPEMIEKAMESLGADKELTVMVGDHQKDIEMAKNAGVASILYYPEDYERFYGKDFQKSLRATHIVESLAEIGQFIEKPR